MARRWLSRGPFVRVLVALTTREQQSLPDSDYAGDVPPYASMTAHLVSAREQTWPQSILIVISGRS